ncbi:hypothetical protein MJO28_000348 [Puccinia striiformis f. sp. tritici]|uniref:Uncharacterized protein n=1 Tax=Puccinia striiformis f. sp. tritici TaxID=168172 RepID=A0ACC0EZS4_9BASI|nr:hypothetical protein MJO28_000348 [Puccinia striiformis f. sp. tritici]
MANDLISTTLVAFQAASEAWTNGKRA